MRYFASPGVKVPAKGDRTRREDIRHRVLVADDDQTFARRLSDYLRDHGFEVRHVSSVSDAKNAVEFWCPDSVFIDLMLPETNALSLFKFMQTRTLKKVPRVIVMSKQTLPQGIETMRRAGAAEYLIKPFPLDEAFRAIDLKTTAPAISPPALPPPADPQSMLALKELHLLGLLLKQVRQGGSTHASLFNLTRMVGLKLHALRCSLIQWVNPETGLVVASNDDENVQGLPIQLANYPEILEVKRTGRPMVIANVRTSDLMAPVKSRLEATPYETLVVFPIFRGPYFYGVLSLRMEQRDKASIHYAESFGSVCSQIISLAITADPS